MPGSKKNTTKILDTKKKHQKNWNIFIINVRLNSEFFSMNYVFQDLLHPQGYIYSILTPPPGNEKLENAEKIKRGKEKEEKERKKKKKKK